MLNILVLFHDIGKLFSKSIDSNNHSHYYGHEIISSHIFREYYRNNNVYLIKNNTHTTKTDLLPEEELMSYMIRHHLDFIAMNERNKVEMIKDMGLYMDVFISLLLLDKCNRISPNGDIDCTKIKNDIDNMYNLID